MIRSIALTRTPDNDTIIQVLTDRDGVEYKKMTRYELLSLVAKATQFLVEDELESQLSRGV